MCIQQDLLEMAANLSIAIAMSLGFPLQQHFMVCSHISQEEIVVNYLGWRVGVVGSHEVAG